MKSGWICWFLVFVFLLGSGWGMNAPAASVTQESGQPRHHSLALYVVPDRRGEDRSGAITGAYIQGMPIVLMVRLVNIDAKHGQTDARPIDIRREWQRDVRFTVTSAGRQVECGIVPLVEEGSVTTSTATALWKDDLIGKWFLDGANTGRMSPGSYRVDCSYGEAVAKPLDIRVDEPRNQQDRLAIQAREVRLHWLKGNYDQALVIGERLLDQREAMSPNDGADLLNLLARTCEKKEQFDKAVVYLEAWLAATQMSDEMNKVVRNRIHHLKEQADKERKRGTPQHPKNAPEAKREPGPGLD